MMQGERQMNRRALAVYQEGADCEKDAEWSRGRLVTRKALMVRRT